MTSDEFRRLGPPLGPEAAWQRTDLFLARAFPFHSRSRWRALCRAGGLLVNGRPVRPAHRLRCGDRLTMHHPLSEEPEVGTGLAVLAEKGGVLAVSKPGNLPMHEGGLFRRHTFEAFLAEMCGKEWAPVHRLDRETSGVVLCAATPALRRKLSAAFEAGRVRKRYWAVLAGATAWDEQAVEAPIALLPGTRRPKFGVAAHGKRAVTHFSVTGRTASATLVDVRPETGKTNQIRVHAAFLGHALVGDKIYHADPGVFAAYCEEGDSARTRALAGSPRHALHALSLELSDPPFSASAPLPDDLQGLYK